MRAGNDEGTRGVLIDIGQVPDHDEAHGHVRERLANAADVQALVARAVSGQVMGPVGMPSAGVLTAVVACTAEAP